ncbi:Regulatory protein PchR [Vibrio aerogenes CECT 7868]|uniref:Regulatory protein PchR n=1 Tax=Vibrio aerogenes CECT 7868 TaxID=1216006 RepID=A0A1M5VPF1_9VIBR|nr:AraC family transcriptional regulator [Vibrio aerogenes]SHH76864.1 Regulatory protein PchR [Vibrio aerogenes CECT 7868]
MMEDVPYRIIVLSGNKTVLAQFCENLFDQPVKIIPVTLNRLVDRVIDIAPDVIVVDATYGRIHHLSATCQLLQKQMNSQQMAVPPVLAVIEGNCGQRGDVLRCGVVDCINYPFDVQEMMMRIEYSLLLLKAAHHGLTPYRSGDRFQALFSDLPEYHELANKTADYLRQHLAEPVTLTRLAQQMNTNRTTLSKAFKQAFSCTVFHWLYQCRMEKAAAYLLRTNFDIRQVAYRVGYPDANNFSTAFKKRFCCSPSEYRLRHQYGTAKRSGSGATQPAPV